MNISSIHRDDLNLKSESKILLENIKRLKQEVSRFQENKPDQIGYNTVLKNIDSIEQSILIHLREIEVLEKALVSASFLGLTKKQITLLNWLVKNYDEEIVYTTLIERISEDLKIPKSTVRWNLRGLREAAFILAGDRENKGIPVRLTEAGRLMASYSLADSS